MTRDDIIKMAHEASPDMTWYAAIDDPTNVSIEELEFLERFAALVAAAERAECAKVCDSLEEQCEKLLVPDEKWPTPADCAVIIRARGQE